MNFFCSKDCPDLCAANITSLSHCHVDGVAEPWSETGFVCRKFPAFVKREVHNGQQSWQRQEEKRENYPDEQTAIAALAVFLEPFRNKRILFLRGSGSLGYNMSCWDQLFANFGQCWNISGGPCDETGGDAHLADFGVIANPDVMQLEQVRHIILYGKNAAATSPHFYAWLKRLKKQGKTIIYIDPLRTETASLADRFIHIRPGFDGVLACALLVRLGLEKGYDSDSLREQAGIDAQDFAFLLECIKTGPTAHIQGSGLQRQCHGMNAFRWINRLAVKTGMQEFLFWTHGSKRLWQTPHAAFSGQIHIDTITAALQDGHFDLFVNVAANPVMTYPDSGAWHGALAKTPTLVIGTNHDETAQEADFFLKVGGMFAQNDFMGSYFFPHHYTRTNITDELSDTGAASLLAEQLRIPLRLVELAQLQKIEQKARSYRTAQLELVLPQRLPGYQLLTSSHKSYLNSQHLPDMVHGLQTVLIHPQDALKEGIKNADRVRVSGSCGSFAARAWISTDTLTGNLMCWKNIPMLEGRCNNAIPCQLTDSGNGLAYYAAFVTLARETE